MRHETLINCGRCGFLQAYRHRRGRGPRICDRCGNTAVDHHVVIWGADAPEGWTSHAWYALRQRRQPMADALSMLLKSQPSGIGRWILKASAIPPMTQDDWRSIGILPTYAKDTLHLAFRPAPPSLLPNLTPAELRSLWGDWLKLESPTATLPVAPWPGDYGQCAKELLELTADALTIPERCVIWEALRQREGDERLTQALDLGISAKISMWMMDDSLTIGDRREARELLNSTHFPFETPLREPARRWSHRLRMAVRQAWDNARPPRPTAIPLGDGPLEDNLRARGLTHWRHPKQKRGAELVYEGGDGIVVLPTGCGKTLCFASAGETLRNEGEGYTLVVSPLVALMSDQVERETGALHAQAGLDTEARLVLLEALEDGAHLLYASPELLLQGKLREELRDNDLLPARIVVDEAHCVLDWGGGFRPDFQRIGNLRKWFEAYSDDSVPLTAFTATLDPKDEDKLAEVLDLRAPVVIRSKGDRPELCWRARPTKSHYHRLKFLIEYLKQRPWTCGIVYTSFKEGGCKLSATAIQSRLEEEGFAVDVYTGGLSSEKRRDLADRLRRGEVQALVATSAFGMGVDLPCLDWVIQMLPTTTIKAYVQGAGRAGRGMDGDLEQADCILLGARGDKGLFSWHLYGSLPKASTVRDMMDEFREQTSLLQKYAFDEPSRTIAINPRTDQARTKALDFASKHSGLKRRRDLEKKRDDDWHVFDYPPTSEGLATYRKNRARMKQDIDKEWKDVLAYINHGGCLREKLLARIGEDVGESYLCCCERCEAVG